jgi:peptidoglycan/xylan/chitin deacetylase (PgdA/CDA1 family)
VSSYATDGRALRRARPLRFRLRTAARRVLLSGLTTLPRRPTRGVRIVHYHYVFEDERDRFERQLRFLAGNLTPVSLSDAVGRLREGAIVGDEVVVTFDDGFRNQLDVAAPLLAEHGFSACFFLVTELLGADEEAARRFCRERLHLPRPVEPLGWGDAERLLELGHELGSHTRSHPDLTAVARERLVEELESSRAELEERFGHVRHFSAPYGDGRRFSAAISEAARTVGYESCASALRGRNASVDDVYALRREHLDASWPVRDVRWFLA